VTSNEGEDESLQKGYRITPAGSRELAVWLQTPPDTSPPPRDELVIKVLVALRLPGVEVQELIQVHRRHLVELMQRYTHLKAETSEHDVGLALVVDAELFRLEAVVRWLDAADTRLASLPAARPAAAPAAPPRRRRRRVEVGR
jgi:Virulence activator alpha C-term